jgi:hypothetical protein
VFQSIAGTCYYLYIKVKVILLLGFINKHHAMRTHDEYKYSSTILNLVIRWRSVDSFMLLRIYPRGTASCTHRIGGSTCPKAGLDVTEKRKIIASVWNRILGRSARSLFAITTELPHLFVYM